jgi:hypothetical protein
MTNNQIVKAFLMERESKGTRGGKALFTDGKRIYSYGVTIGFNMGGRSFVIDYTAKGGHWLSQTTSQHVGMLKRESGVKVITSDEYEQGFKHLVQDL